MKKMRAVLRVTIAQVVSNASQQLDGKDSHDNSTSGKHSNKQSDEKMRVVTSHDNSTMVSTQASSQMNKIHMTTAQMLSTQAVR